MATTIGALPVTESRARDLDGAGRVGVYRDLFHLPPWPDGRYPELAYLLGNSLGPQPRGAFDAVGAELDTWAKRGVEGYFDGGDRCWYGYGESMRGPLARLVGARPSEVVVMNSLTVNLHVMMTGFYRPSGRRRRILIEDHAFPSDSHAVSAQAAIHRLDPAETVVRLRPRDGEVTLRTSDVVTFLEAEGDTVALVLLGGVNYLTGELHDIGAITAAGHAAGATVGWDLAHAAGNVPLSLHDWGVDWAAWCSYKYLNGGPGAPGACFVHERHLESADRPRLAGWWGTDPTTRFEMSPVFEPDASAAGWQTSTPSVLAMAPLRAALDIADRMPIADLANRSAELTGFLLELLDHLPVQVVTPRDPARRGAQLSIRPAANAVAYAGAGELVERMRKLHGVVVDHRAPGIIRLAPAPLYNTFHDCWRAAEALRLELDQ